MAGGAARHSKFVPPCAIYRDTEPVPLFTLRTRRMRSATVAASCGWGKKAGEVGGTGGRGEGQRELEGGVAARGYERRQIGRARLLGAVCGVEEGGWGGLLGAVCGVCVWGGKSC